jgi:phosphatidylglycerophosphatase A
MENKQVLDRKQKLAVLLATWFGSGLIPPLMKKSMAGTYGSFFSIPLCLLAIAASRVGVCDQSGRDFIYAFVAIIVLLVGLWAIPIAEVALGPRTDWKGRTRVHDQNQIVIDETLGMLVACWPLAYPSLAHGLRWWHFALAFGLFRLFDITKPPGVRYFDRQVNAFGVMMDDGIAGVYAAIGMIIALLLFR